MHEIVVPDGKASKILEEMAFFMSLLVLTESLRWGLDVKDDGDTDWKPQSSSFASRSANRGRVRQVLKICSLVLAWYTVSITLILYNKWVISYWEHDGVGFTVLYTSTHMLIKGLLASGFFIVQGKSLPRIEKYSIVILSLAGALAAFDIAASNVSLIYLSASFYTFLKSASVVFTLVFATLLCIETWSVSIVTTVVLVSLGMFITTYGETNFNLVGFVLVMMSECFAAMRWLLTEIALKGQNLDAMTIVLYMSPASFVSLVPFVVQHEQAELRKLSNWHDSGIFLLLIAFPATLAFLLILVEIYIIKETSSLTLTVFGNLKSVATIVFAVFVFKEETTVLQWVGLVVALTGMIAYSHARGEWSFASLGDSEEDEKCPILSRGALARNEDEKCPILSRGALARNEDMRRQLTA